jgi:hypothetical protein
MLMHSSVKPTLRMNELSDAPEVALVGRTCHDKERCTATATVSQPNVSYLYLCRKLEVCFLVASV